MPDQPNQPEPPRNVGRSTVAPIIPQSPAQALARDEAAGFVPGSAEDES